MFNILFPLFSLGSYNDPEYYNLDQEEKENYDFVQKCILSENKKINDASFNLSIMLIELINEPEKYTPEEIDERKKHIYSELNEEEIETMEKFLLSYINTIGIYSEEAKQERKLRKERNDK